MDSGESQEDAKVLINRHLVECFGSENFFNFQRKVGRNGGKGHFIHSQKKMDDLLLPASIAATFLNLLVIFCAFRLQRRRATGDDSANLFIMSGGKFNLDNISPQKKDMAFGDLLLTRSFFASLYY